MIIWLAAYSGWSAVHGNSVSYIHLVKIGTIEVINNGNAGPTPGQVKPIAQCFFKNSTAGFKAG